MVRNVGALPPAPLRTWAGVWASVLSKLSPGAPSVWPGLMKGSFLCTTKDICLDWEVPEGVLEEVTGGLRLRGGYEPAKVGQGRRYGRVFQAGTSMWKGPVV